MKITKCSVSFSIFPQEARSSRYQSVIPTHAADLIKLVYVYEPLISYGHPINTELCIDLLYKNTITDCKIILTQKASWQQNLYSLLYIQGVPKKSGVLVWNFNF